MRQQLAPVAYVLPAELVSSQPFHLIDDKKERRLTGDVVLVVYQEIKAQAALGGPLWANFALQYSTSLVCIAAVGHLGQTELAAASMSVSLYGILGRTTLLSLTGALDTQASQARICVSFSYQTPPSL